MTTAPASLFTADALKDEVALVTGASRGIGRAILEHLGRAGATVVGTATTEAGAAGIGARLAELGLRGEGAVLDVRDAAAGDALVERIVRGHGRLSVLVNNAGITRDGLAMRMKDDDWSAVIDTNLTAAFRLSRAVLRGMARAKHGRIVNVTSVVGSLGNGGQANYSAAKAGLAGLTRSLARELGSRNITVNCVAPGFIDTDMTRALGEEAARALTATIALGRFGSVDDVAAAVTFLASPAAAYVTGTTLHVNGGMYMT